MNNNINKDNANIEENLKQVIINDSTNLEAIKLLIEQLFSRNDLSNVYVFCNTAIKINEKEQGLWELMAEYYRLNNDEMKYYECSMKELTNSSKHASFNTRLISSSVASLLIIVKFSLIDKL